MVVVLNISFIVPYDFVYPVTGIYAKYRIYCLVPYSSLSLLLSLVKSMISSVIKIASLVFTFDSKIKKKLN